MIALIKVVQKGNSQKLRPFEHQTGRNAECGSAILETALSLIVLLTFLFGIVETAFMLYTYHFIAEASREGVRYAIVHGNSAGATCPAYTSPNCAATKAEITSYVKNFNFPGIDPGKMTVNTTYAGYPAGVTCTPSASCNNPGNLVTIHVTYSFPLVIPFVPARSFTLSSTSAMVISQ